MDLYSGAGGSACGLMQAGFHVTGIDIGHQPRYCGDEFIRADAMSFLEKNWSQFHAIHASPPPNHDARRLKAWLDYFRKPYAIEEGQLAGTVTLCGTMFGLELYRHRTFKTNFPVAQPPHKFHVHSAVHSDQWKPGLIMNVFGNCAPIEHARDIMGINWMLRDELTQATPPAYARYVGDSLRRRLNQIGRAA